MPARAHKEFGARNVAVEAAAHPNILMLSWSAKPDIAALHKRVDDIAKRQIPYAASLALNQVARRAVEAERDTMRKELDRPTRFTLRGVAMSPSRKETLTATVYIQPLQAHYLAPVILGGPQVLADGKRAVLAPKNVRLDANGNLPRGLLEALRARPDIFVGTVTFHSGQTIDGVWQLPPGEHKGTRSQRSIVGGRRKGWKLLIRFADPAPVKARYQFGKATIATSQREFGRTLRWMLSNKALPTAR